MHPWYPEEVLPLLPLLKRQGHHFNASGALLLEQNIGVEPHPLIGSQMLYQLSYILQYSPPGYLVISPPKHTPLLQPTIAYH